MIQVGLQHYLVLAAILFSAGLCTMVVKRNAIGILIGAILFLVPLIPLRGALTKKHWLGMTQSSNLTCAICLPLLLWPACLHCCLHFRSPIWSIESHSIG